MGFFEIVNCFVHFFYPKYSLSNFKNNNDLLDPFEINAKNWFQLNCLLFQLYK